MKKSLLSFIALAFLAIPSLSMAAPPQPGPYVSGFLGATVPNDADVSSFNYNDKVEYDVGVYAGGTGGYDFGWLRMEGELSYRRAHPSRVNDRITGQTFTGINDDGGIGIFSMMGNMFVDIHNPSPVTPYLGGGIGFAAMHQDDTLGTSNTWNRVILYQADDDTVFAYQVGAGLEVTLTRMFSLDFSYRYFRTATAHFNKGSGVENDLKFDSHNAAAGLRIKF